MTDTLKIMEWIEGFEYKPGFSFAPGPMQYGPRISVMIDHLTPDANGERRGPVRIGSVTSPVPDHIETLEDFSRWLVSQINKRERHETLEWLRYKGQRVFDPHPNGDTAYGPTHYILEKG